MQGPPQTGPRALLSGMLRQALPASLRLRLRKWRLGLGVPPVGGVDFGDLARTTPIAPHYGYLRGGAVDRYYIEGFLARRGADIRGRVLEVATAIYARAYGQGVSQVDELDSIPGPNVAFAGDIGTEGLLPSDAFDSIVFTQTLQYVFEPAVAVAQLYRALKPGGVLLATIPVITPLEPGDNGWLWTFTPKVARRLFHATFGAENCSIEIHGNVFAATCYLHGIVVEDIDTKMLEPVDECYPVTIAIRAVKRAA
ncbi:class I SAM-dependent methyltransferase [Novosphingobium cyanobacteriorum]|uniref:Methyltransferase domain-containing protein n=1 Tax=Novosphingobium cyanobacteriorum TaxID=3024215 RepID=A0ABT6CGS4_9SPHN|nr:methyltransferase domain-containing protein [Novosphingobium cyanobacteriorum]MDF8333126.1 methyltransferase domain-containing protein [Novosphingobium cyanobacteriorum]